MADDDTTRIIRPKSTPQDNVNTTKVMGKEDFATTARREDSDTRLFRPSSESKQTSETEGDFGTDPVVGWLVVVEGNGKGNSLVIGYGVNGIGRDRDERISLPFGDEQISRKGHAYLTYDGKNKKFFLQHGQGVNLTYLNDQAVLQVVELSGREIIGIGDTKLAFVPFCGEKFSW